MINVDSLSFRYPGQQEDTIKRISFDIMSGEIFGFLGPSGSGKSTTQRVLTGLLKRFEGEIFLLERPLRDWGQDLYNHIGVGFELPNHFSKLTGLENLNLFASFYGKNRAGDVASPMALLKLVELDDSANKRVSAYSKGMKMRLNFARALLNNPQLLFLDEPTAGLDPVTARLIKNTILRLKSEGKTIFLTTHNMHDADELCDHVGFIVDGELRLVGAPDTLKKEHGAGIVRAEFAAADAHGPANFQDYGLKGLGTNNEFLQSLREKELISIHSQEASLEEVFIKTTGAQLI